MTVIVFSPHPDDEALGVGGTIAKYAQAGERVIVVVFSAGTASHPLHKERLITRARKEEALASHKALGVSESVFLMLDDNRLKESIIENEIILKLHDLIKKEKPGKLFIPAIDDIHKDHRAVTHAILQLHSQYELTCPVFTYTIWNPLAVFKRGQPRLVVDVTDTHRAKMAALGEYKTQWISIYQLTPVVVVKAFLAGMRYGCRWAEVFLQVR